MAIIDLADVPDFVHTEATWEEYEELLEATRDSHLRITYDRGQLEIVPPSFKHEQGKKLLARLVEALMDERRIKSVCGGELTMRRKVLLRGLQPDESYWIANYAAMIGKRDWDPEHDPPPDLTVEVDVSRSSINRLGIYSALGVPEVWRYAREHLTVYRLDEEGGYQTCQVSPTFPDVPIDVLERFVTMGLNTTPSEAVWALEDWLRNA